MHAMNYTKLGKHTVNAVRLAEVIQVFARHGFADLLGRTGIAKNLKGLLHPGTKRLQEGPPETFGYRLRSALTELGPAFVKMGQVLSTRPDLVGHAIATELSLLQDQVHQVPFSVVEPVFYSELGDDCMLHFAALEREAAAAASLSQVYKATLTTGEIVAIKVQRPGIERTIESDLSLLQQLGDWIADHVDDTKGLDPRGIVDEFSRSIRRELDFTIEAHVIEQFRRNFEGQENVIIPRVFPHLSARRIITMDWVDGVRVDRLEAYSERGSDPRVVAIHGCDALCKMVFEHHLFHADPHPGNIFLTHGNRLAFLDLGMAGHLERIDVAAIADLFYAMFQTDSLECANAILTLTTHTEMTDRVQLEREIAEFIAFEAQAIVSGGHVARGIERATEILHRVGLELAPRFSLLLKALATIEMVGRRLDPHLDMVPIIQPYVENLLTQRYQPQHLWREARNNAHSMLRLTRRMPGDFSYLLQLLRSGRLKFQIHHEHLEGLAATIDRSSSRNTVGLIVAALIVGSSLLITVESSISRLGVAGFIFAAVLGCILVLSILWSRKF
ncbi:MAG: hypothetical protein HYV27_20155 [Candidatus Hydrogenedentes bacterium]|nr:hypothetical protein [Candidatus Hydrogenedentota bacterium]